MMIRILSTEVQMIEGKYFGRWIIRLMKDIRGLEIKVFTVPGTRLGMVVCCVTKVSKFMNLRWPVS